MMITHISQWFVLWFRRYQEYFEYGFLTFLVVAPFLKTGFVFALDLSYTPTIRFPDIVDHLYVFHVVEWFIGHVLPGSLIEKVFIVLALGMGGIGMHQLVPTRSAWPKYFAGLLYMFNPFVYSRMLYGQLLIVLAYSLTPFAVKSFIHMFRSKQLNDALKAGIWLSVIALVSLHNIFFILLLLSSFFFFSVLWRWNQWSDILRFFFLTMICLAILFFSISYWVIPFFMGESAIAQFVSSTISIQDVYSFQTDADPTYGVLWNTAALYGFWGDREGRYVPQKEIVPWWFPLYIILLSIILWRLILFIFSLRKKLRWRHTFDINREKDDGWITLSLVVVGLAAFILGVGVAYKPFIPLINFLNEQFVFFRGYREPQKFVSLLVLVYAYFGAEGADDLISRFRNFFGKAYSKLSSWNPFLAKRGLWEDVRREGRRYLLSCLRLMQRGIPVFFIAIPLLYSPGMLWGFQGQLYTSQYPDSWYDVNGILNRDRDAFHVLFLPWHQYIYLQFIRKTVANPAERFFDKSTLAGDNMEFGPIYTQSTRPESKFIEQEILGNKSRFIETNEKKPESSLGEKLNELNIKYVIWAEESDFFNYDFVSKTPDLELVHEGERIKLYQNKLWGLRYSNGL